MTRSAFMKALNENPDAAFCVKQIAEMMGVSEATVYAQIHKGALRAFRFGKCVRVRGHEVLRYERVNYIIGSTSPNSLL